MRPLRVKASSYPVSSSNFQGLQEMTDAEIRNYYAAVLTEDFATNTDGTGTAELNVTTDGSGSGTTIGTATDTKRTEAVGTHPASGGTTTVTTYTAKQVNAAASESITNRPLGYETSGTTGANQFNDSELDTDILDKVIADMVTENTYTVGQYKLATSAPSGGTWTSRYTITNTEVDGTTTNYYIWQKTAATTAKVSNNKPVKYDSGVKEMTEAEMEQITPNLRNRIIDNTIGTYKLQASSPSGGTWVRMGDYYYDTRKEISSQGYEGSYTGNYTGGYTGAKNYAGSYSGDYSGNYTGNYSGTSAYSGTYAGSYTGSYTPFFAGYQGPTSYSGTYTGYYTGYYTGAKNYAGTYSGTYSGSYTGYYAGTSAYSGTYAGTYTGYYSGDTIQSSSENVSNVALWVKTAN
tara:strand:- start:23245 stop:24462 length:1218 start_codon:yes stop_codon:yes gene_type:complete